MPIEQWEDGSIRVGGTRLLIDMIVHAHNCGESPEDIHEAFPSSSYTVADIYAVIAYYLSHKSEIDKYLADREKEAEEIWEKIEADPVWRVGLEKLLEMVRAFAETQKDKWNTSNP